MSQIIEYRAAASQLKKIEDIEYSDYSTTMVALSTFSKKILEISSPNLSFQLQEYPFSVLNKYIHALRSNVRHSIFGIWTYDNIFGIKRLKHN